MKTLLVECPACVRHVRVTEIRCPFCGANLPESLREQEAAAPVGRLSRAALYALRAGALSMTAAACGGAVSGGSGRENNSSASASFAAPYGGFPAEDASNLPLYGAFMAEDAGPPDAGEMTDVSTGTIAAYGGFFPGTLDGSEDAEPPR